MRAIGMSTIWNGMKQANSIKPKTILWPGNRYFVST